MAPKLIEKVVRPEPTKNSLNRTEFVDKPDWMIDPVKAENNLHYVEGVGTCILPCFRSFCTDVDL